LPPKSEDTRVDTKQEPRYLTYPLPSRERIGEGETCVVHGEDRGFGCVTHPPMGDPQDCRQKLLKRGAGFFLPGALGVSPKFIILPQSFQGRRGIKGVEERSSNLLEILERTG